jgi:hypothetical protein
VHLSNGSDMTSSSWVFVSHTAHSIEQQALNRAKYQHVRRYWRDLLAAYKKVIAFWRFVKEPLLRAQTAEKAGYEDLAVC